MPGLNYRIQNQQLKLWKKRKKEKMKQLYQLLNGSNPMQAVPANCVRPLPLQGPKLGEAPSLPIADLNLLPYVKKNRRRKGGLPNVSCRSSSATSRGPAYPVCGGPSAQCYSSDPNNNVTTSPVSDLGTGYLTVDNNNNINNSSSGVINGSHVELSYPAGRGSPTQANYQSYELPHSDLSPPGSKSQSVPPVTPVACVSSVPEAPPTYCVMSQGGQGATYWMPMVAMPGPAYPNNVNQPVNLGWGPSHDPYGKDLPISGVEYYRMSACGAPSTYQPGLMYPPGGEMAPVLMDTAGYGQAAMVGVPPDVTREFTSSGGAAVRSWEGTGSRGHVKTTSSHASVPVARHLGKTDHKASESEASVKCDDKDKDSSSDKNSKNETTATSGNSSSNNNVETKPDPRGTKAHGNETGDLDLEEEGDMEVGSDGDSGCPSECTDLSPLAPESDVTTSSATADTVGAEEGVKPRGKRRYYMYGNHKLVKPIKEIPLRFQMLLAETSAAKARCEGQPIYMQQAPQQPVYDMVYYQPTADQQGTLNANTPCFVPSQQQTEAAQPGYLPECYTMCPVSGGYTPTAAPASNTNNPSLQPSPLFVPPAPPSMPSSTPPCQTFIVYSSPSSSTAQSSSPAHHVRSITMPPPPFPPPSNQPPPAVEHLPNKSAPSLSPAVNQVVVSISGPHPQSKPTDSAVKNVASKPHTILSVPPPNHMQHPPHMNPSLASIHQSSLPPPPNPSMHLNNTTTVLTVPQVVNHLAPPPNSAPVTHVPPPSLHVSSSNSSNVCPNAPQSYESSSGQQYMYVYPSPPAGHSSPPSQVMYMVSPSYPSPQAYQQTGVLVPPNCPVPVQ